MKTMPPSRALVRLNRLLTLAVLGFLCVTLWICCKGRGLWWLVRESTRRMTLAGLVTEAEVPGGRLVALVPGTSIRGNLLRQRVEAAARLYHAGSVSHLILSGDGRAATYDEPRAMRRMLADLGVPPHVMIEDAGGLSTYESIQRAGSIAAGNRLLIVTQELHCSRALMLAWGMGLDALACALPSTPAPASVAREEKAIVRAALDLAGLRSWTEKVEKEGRVVCAGVTLAAF
jgi:vancomycin permeability regulator SanA